MGYAFTTLANFFAVQNPLHGLKKLLSYPQRSSASALRCDFRSHRLSQQKDADAVCMSVDNDTSTNSCLFANQLPIKPPVQQPVRGNWPFTVRPPFRPHNLPAPSSALAQRSFLTGLEVLPIEAESVEIAL